MINIEQLLLLQASDIQAAIEKLDNNKAHIVLVIDNHRRLVGTVTDGDVRRGILRGVKLSDSVVNIMNRDPVIGKQGQDKNLIYTLMRTKQIRQIPILSNNGQVCAIEILDDLIHFDNKDNPVVLMAGGFSTRLRPLTDDCPKPMLKVGGRPILETILTRLIQFGFCKFYISINYLGGKIRDYFQDGSKWGVQIEYLQEHDKMGTAGPLSMVRKPGTKPLLVMNSDLLTKVDFNQLLAFHQEQSASATMCVREFEYTVPYGICKLDHNTIVEIEEKPTYKFFINAGVYVLEPTMLKMIPQSTYFDMPALFSLLIKLKHQVVPFPIREYWLDIGQHADFDKAHSEFKQVFELNEM